MRAQEDRVPVAASTAPVTLVPERPQLPCHWTIPGPRGSRFPCAPVLQTQSRAMVAPRRWPDSTGEPIIHLPTDREGPSPSRGRYRLVRPGQECGRAKRDGIAGCHAHGPAPLSRPPLTNVPVRRSQDPPGPASPHTRREATVLDGNRWAVHDHVAFRATAGMKSHDQGHFARHPWAWSASVKHRGLHADSRTHGLFIRVTGTSDHNGHGTG